MNTRVDWPCAEVVPVTQINRVYEALDKNNDSGTRYVLAGPSIHHIKI